MGMVFVVRTALGVVVGLGLSPVVFLWSFWRGARAVHARGVVCMGEIVGLDAEHGDQLAGRAVVRLSGAFEDDGASGSDVLGLAVRWLPAEASESPDLRCGNQDLLLGSFESFKEARRARETTVVDDFFANTYHSVSWWWLRGLGPIKLRAVPKTTADAARGADRTARLDHDIAADQARYVLETGGDSPRRLAELRLVERLSLTGDALRISMFRSGRGLRPVGGRNGIRAIVYPMSQLARRLRGG